MPIDTVNPGESATFRSEVTAPATAGQYASQWGMQREGFGSFGASTNNVTVHVTEPVNNAQPAGQTVLTQVEAGKSYTVSVTMVNNGETTWTRAQNYILMSRYPWNDMSWGLNRVALPFDPVAPGQTATFTFQITAPTTPGSYPFQWGMLREGVVVFGPGTNLEMVNVVAPPPATSDAQVIGMTVPPRMVAGTAYNVAVTMRNTGNTTWTPGVHTLGSANPYDNLTWGLGRVALATAVAPGQDYTFNFQVTAPAAGSYTMAWGVLSQTAWFGTLASSPVTVTENLGNVTFIHTDGLGSPVARTDATGNVISRTRYEPYGYTASGATPTIGFTGHVNDADTGLTYMQQRYYDPVAGRFLSIDPVTTDANTGGSFNRYSYANNNPYKYVDPDGRSAYAKFKALGLLVRNGHLTVHPVTGIPFRDGFPDFSRVAMHTVEITQTGNNKTDFAAANLAAGLKETPKGYTWHHNEDEKTMQLVPSDIHAKTGHSGGAALTKAMAGIALSMIIGETGARVISGEKSSSEKNINLGVQDFLINIIPFSAGINGAGQGSDVVPGAQTPGATTGPRGCMAPGGNCW